MSKESEEIFHKVHIAWFPGHMAKTKRLLKEALKNIDLVVEVLDARIPYSSSNPDLNQIIENKPKIIILNKSDLSDPTQNQKWIKHYEATGYPCMEFSSKSNKYVSDFKNKVLNIMEDKIQKFKSKGLLGYKIRVMVVGIPNSGKSVGNQSVRLKTGPVLRAKISGIVLVIISSFWIRPGFYGQNLMMKKLLIIWLLREL